MTLPLPKVIVVPTDFGEPAAAALDAALAYAKAFNAEVVVLHAYEIPVVGFPDGAMVITADLTRRILEGAETAIDELVKAREAQGVPMRGLVRQGDPHRVVNDVAAELGAGLIAIGTHGRKGLSRALLGSVAEKVVRTAHVPVLAVHAPDVVTATVAPPMEQELGTAN